MGVFGALDTGETKKEEEEKPPVSSIILVCEDCGKEWNYDLKIEPQIQFKTKLGKPFESKGKKIIFCNCGSENIKLKHY